MIISLIKNRKRGLTNLNPYAIIKIQKREMPFLKEVEELLGWARSKGE
jgi:hypothetical protein